MSPENSFKETILGGTFSFTLRPDPIPGDLRMSWGIGILLLSLFYSRGKRGSFQKLQFLAHAIRLQEGRADVRAMLRGDIRPSDVSVRVEPWLNRAVAYAHGLGLANVTKGKSVVLTGKGENIAKAIDTRNDIFSAERAFLSEVAPTLTEQKVTKIWQMESLL